MNNNCYFLFDFETTSAMPDRTQPVQVAGMAVEPRTLKKKNNSEFNILMKPLYGEEAKAELVDELQDGAIRVHGKTHEILADAPSIGTGINNFCEHVATFNSGAGIWGKPVPVTYNGLSFDIPILKRYCNKFNIPFPFHPIMHVDLMHHMFTLFENDRDVGRSRSADNLVRGYMGYKDPEGMSAHDALGDVYLLHRLLKEYLTLQRKLNKSTKLKNGLCT